MISSPSTKHALPNKDAVDEVPKRRNSLSSGPEPIYPFSNSRVSPSKREEPHKSKVSNSLWASSGECSPEQQNPKQRRRATLNHIPHQHSCSPETHEARKSAAKKFAAQTSSELKDFWSGLKRTGNPVLRRASLAHVNSPATNAARLSAANKLAVSTKTPTKKPKKSIKEPPDSSVAPTKPEKTLRQVPATLASSLAGEQTPGSKPITRQKSASSLFRRKAATKNDEAKPISPERASREPITRQKSASSLFRRKAATKNDEAKPIPPERASRAANVDDGTPGSPTAALSPTKSGMFRRVFLPKSDEARSASPRRMACSSSGLSAAPLSPSKSSTVRRVLVPKSETATTSAPPCVAAAGVPATPLSPSRTSTVSRVVVPKSAGSSLSSSRSVSTTSRLPDAPLSPTRTVRRVVVRKVVGPTPSAPPQVSRTAEDGVQHEAAASSPTKSSKARRVVAVRKKVVKPSSSQSVVSSSGLPAAPSSPTSSGTVVQKTAGPGSSSRSVTPSTGLPAAPSSPNKSGTVRRVVVAGPGPPDSRSVSATSRLPTAPLSPDKSGAVRQVVVPKSAGPSSSRSIGPSSGLPPVPLSPGKSGTVRRVVVPKSAGPSSSRSIGPSSGLPPVPLSPGKSDTVRRVVVPKSAGPSSSRGLAPSSGLPPTPLSPVKSGTVRRVVVPKTTGPRPSSSQRVASSSGLPPAPLSPSKFGTERRVEVTNLARPPFSLNEHADPRASPDRRVVAPEAGNAACCVTPGRTVARRSSLVASIVASIEGGGSPRPPRRASLSHVPLLPTSDQEAAYRSPQPYKPKYQGPQTPGIQHSPMKKKMFRQQILSQTEELLHSKNSRLYEYARRCKWDKVAEELRMFPRDAKSVDEQNGTTALHLAVMSRANPSVRDGDLDELQPAPIELIEDLVVACPEAAITRCSSKKYTPLVYACLVLHRGYHMTDSAEMVTILLRHAPHSAYVFTDDGLSALDVHILSYSRYHKGKEKECYTDGQKSTSVLEVLLKAKPDLAEARTYKNKVSGPVELLYRSNLEEFKHIGDDDNRLRNGLDESLHKGTESLWWAWQWVALILLYAARPSDVAKCEKGDFKALHAAASLVGCPLPVLSIAARTYPQELRCPDPNGTLGNLPLHQVCSWVCDNKVISGDPFAVRRKAMAIQCLLEAYPEAAHVTNKMGETPLQLAIESCTLWDGGLEALVHANPHALTIPRMVRDCSGENDLLLSREFFEDEAESVDGSDLSDPFEPVNGMMPFMVAAVVAQIPRFYLTSPSFAFSDRTPEERKDDVKKKDLESIRTIFGLLRAKPEALSMFKPIPLVKRDDASVGSDYTEYTEVTLEE